MNKIRIKISGNAKIGKSRVLYIIKSIFKEYGFNIKHYVGIDEIDEDYYDEIHSKDLKAGINNIKKKSEITLIENNKQDNEKSNLIKAISDYVFCDNEYIRSKNSKNHSKDFKKILNDIEYLVNEFK